ncbi:MAG: hypothetical protein WEB58_09025 [Planctomycetaceae bacterium]
MNFEWWADVGKYIVAILVAAVGILLYFKKEIFDQILAAVQDRYDRRMEHLRTELGLQAFRDETQFAALHARRAVVIAKTYRLMRDMVKATERFPGDLEQLPGTPASERLEDVSTALAAFRSYYAPRQLYFPKSTADRIESLRSGCFGVVQSFRRIPPDDKKIESVFQRLTDELQPLFERLEAEFRELLGIVE